MSSAARAFRPGGRLRPEQPSATSFASAISASKSLRIGLAKPRLRRWIFSRGVWQLRSAWRESSGRASVSFWMARDFQYRQSTAESEESSNAWVRELPFADMVKYGWLRPVPRRSDELSTCLKFFDVPSVAVWHRVQSH